MAVTVTSASGDGDGSGDCDGGDGRIDYGDGCHLAALFARGGAPATAADEAVMRAACSRRPERQGNSPQRGPVRGISRDARSHTAREHAFADSLNWSELSVGNPVDKATRLRRRVRNKLETRLGGGGASVTSSNFPRLSRDEVVTRRRRSAAAGSGPLDEQRQPIGFISRPKSVR